MKNDWGIVGCAYMAQEYCKVLVCKGITPQIFSRDLVSDNVKKFQKMFPQLTVKTFSAFSADVDKWIVCTNIESHEVICNQLQGRIYCEKPFSHDTHYDTREDIYILLNRRYYYWVNYIKEIINSGKIVKVVACIPERGIGALITQSIHVVDLLWYLTGKFGPAKKAGKQLPTYFLSTDKDIPVIINMNYGAHENFSIRFYTGDGVVYEAKPLEAFTITQGMEVREPDDDMPLRSYRPISHPLGYMPTNHKPGLEELIDDLIQNKFTRLPKLAEHRDVHVWMEGNML
jgi:predicted dehydrogenase